METLGFLLVWGLIGAGILLLVFAIVMGFKGRGVPSPHLLIPSDETRRQTDLLKRQTEIMERNRMEAWSQPDYFNKGKK